MVPLPLVMIAEGEDEGCLRLTVKYNSDVYVMRSHTSDAGEIQNAEERIDAALFVTTCKARTALKKKQEKKRKNGKLTAMKVQMQNMQENTLRIDKRNGRVHFAGNDVSTLDVRMDVVEYGGCKPFTLEYNGQLYTMAPPASKGRKVPAEDDERQNRHALQQLPQRVGTDT